jgi:hypothetical protein
MKEEQIKQEINLIELSIRKLINNYNINHIDFIMHGFNEEENIIKLEVNYEENKRYKIESLVNKKPLT